MCDNSNGAWSADTNIQRPSEAEPVSPDSVERPEQTLLPSSPNTIERPEQTSLISELKESDVEMRQAYRIIHDVCQLYSKDRSLRVLRPLAQELWSAAHSMCRTKDAMLSEHTAYTRKLESDISKVAEEFSLCVAEIKECITAIRNGYGTYRSVFCPWFFKKDRVPCMIKYIQVLKTQLCLMRIVIYEVACERLAKKSNITLDIAAGLVDSNPAILPAATLKYDEIIEELRKYNDQIKTECSEPNEPPTEQARSTSGAQQSHDANDNDPYALPYQYHLNLSVPGLTDDDTDSFVSARSIVHHRFTQRINLNAHCPIVSAADSAMALRKRWIVPDLVVAVCESEETPNSKSKARPVVLDRNLDLVGSGPSTEVVERWLYADSDEEWDRKIEKARHKAAKQAKNGLTASKLLVAIRDTVRASVVGRVVAGGLRGVFSFGKKKDENEDEDGE